MLKLPLVAATLFVGFFVAAQSSAQAFSVLNHDHNVNGKIALNVVADQASEAEKTTWAELGAIRQALVSAGLGAKEDLYRARAEGEGFLLASPAQGLTASVGGDGVQVRGAIGSVGMHLLGWGCEAILVPVSGGHADAGANRVEIAHKGITEWYIAGPLGIEQGFTVVSPAVGCEVAGELVIELEIAGSAVLSADRRSLNFPAVGQRYCGLVAVDAAGRELPARLELAGQRLVIRTEVAGARWPVTVDPTFVAEAKLLALDGVAFDGLGFSAAISGATIVVGVTNFDSEFTGLGGSAAYVFTEPAGGWMGTLPDTAKLVASEGNSTDQFGWRVAVFGSTVVVGAPLDNVIGHGQLSGSAYIFTEPAGGWVGTLTETAKLIASDGAPFDRLGASVAISAGTVFLGAWGGGDFDFSGAAYVFTEPAGGWAGTLTEAARLLASDGVAFDALGESIAVSGTTVVVGASRDGDFTGAAYVFTEPVGGWTGTLTEAAKLVASDPAAADQDQLGLSVAVSGSTVVVGAPGDGHGVSYSPDGSAYVFTEPVGGWVGTLTETAKLVASVVVAGENLGRSVGVSGSNIVVGSWSDFDNGRALLFTEPAPGWAGTLNEDAEFLASDPVIDDRFGFSVAASGCNFVVGSPFNDENGIESGAAYVFDRVPCDTDGDGIDDGVDTLPFSFSNDFSDGTTTGNIVERGDQVLMVKDAKDLGDGVSIMADSSGGAAVATVSACSGALEFSLFAGDGVIVTCGSVTIEAISGLVKITFVADDDTLVTTILVQGNTLMFEPDTLTITAPVGNPDVAVVLVDGVSISLAPGGSVRLVKIDIKPGSNANSINLKSKGSVPVAVLSADDFDASVDLDASTLTFGPSGARIAHRQGHVQDVDGDGDLDMLLHFKTKDTGIACGDTTATLKGETFGGQAVESTDTITTVGCK